MDYESLSTTLMFAACETRRCVNVVIEDDVLVERDETVVVTLETPDSGCCVVASPVTGKINILNNDGNYFLNILHHLSYSESVILPFNPVAVVGLERTLYHTAESVGVVEVCAVVYSPHQECPIVFPFDIKLSTADRTAGMHVSYINVQQTHECSVTIPVSNSYHHYFSDVTDIIYISFPQCLLWIMRHCLQP